MMNQKFEELSAAALTAADSTLAHIAEREQLTMQQNARIAARTLEKAGLAQKAQKPVQHKKRLRMFAAVAAAAVMLAGTAIGISAYVGHNKDVTQSRFGAGCETTFEALTMQEAVSVSNGRASVTLEGCVNDGIQQMVLVSIAAEPGTEPVDLMKLNTSEWHDADGNLFTNWLGSAYEIQTQGETTLLDKFYYAYYLTYDEALAGQTLTLTYPKLEDGRDVLTGIEIPVLMQQNTDAAEYVSASGETLRLSGFELVYSITAEERDREQTIMNRKIVLIGTDGSRHRTFAKSDAPIVCNPSARCLELYAEKNAGDWGDAELRYEICRARDYMGWFDTEQIAAVEIDGVTYTRAK